MNETVYSQIKLKAARKSLPFCDYYHVSLHSPNNLPDFTIPIDFIRLNNEQGISMDYKYNRIQRLGKSYDTDCYDYDSDTSFGYYRMRSDCVNDCYQDQLRKICKVNHRLFMSHALLRKDYLINGNNRLLSCYDTEYNQQ